MAGLTVRNIGVDRLGQSVVHDLDLDAPAGEVTVLLGANGVGKSTLLDGISGVAPTRCGTVHLDEVDITKRSRTKRVAAGLAYVQQGRAIFPSLTVEENFLVTAPETEFARAFALFPELEARAQSKTAVLSGGEQQMVVLGRALLQRPKILMIDELSLGLAPIVVDRMLGAVRQMAADGMGVLLVEQFANQALTVGDSAIVMSRGDVVLSGPASEIAADPDRLKAAYLGTNQQQENN